MLPYSSSVALRNISARQPGDLPVEAAYHIGDDKEDGGDDARNDDGGTIQLPAQLGDKNAGIPLDDQLPGQLGDITRDDIIFAGISGLCPKALRDVAIVNETLTGRLNSADN